jgi:peptidyl-prolyl cis-trans isomerase C
MTMSLKRTRLAGILLAAALTVAACDKMSAPVTVDTSKPAAVINGEPITEARLDFLLKRVGQPDQPNGEKQRQLVLDQMIKRELMTQYALKNKLDQDLDVYLALQEQRESVLVSAAERSMLKELPEITDEQLKARYDKEVAAVSKTEYHPAHIVVETEDEAKQIIADIKKGKDFAALAKARSKGATKDKGGDLGWLQEGTVVPEFFAALGQLKDGEITQTPVKTQFGWHVIKLLESRPVSIPPFEKLKGQIKRLMQREALEARLAELKAQAKIEIQ